MKPFKIILLLALFPLILSAKSPGSGPNGGQMGRQANRTGMQDSISPSGSPQQGMSTLQQFLSLDDEALEQLEATIHRIRQMTPDERADFQDKILEYQRMPTEERQHIQQAWGRLDSSVRAAWRNYMMGLEPDERDSVRRQLQSIPPESRTNWRIEILEKAGLLIRDPSGEKP